MSRAVLLLSVLSFLLFGCEPNRVPPEDGGFRDTPDAGSPGEDAPLDDAPLPTDDVPGLDAGTDAGMVVDPGATPPPTVTRSGTGGVLLQGTVLTPTGPLVGEVLVVGNTITCVAASCASAPMAGTVTVVDTHGAIISPGLLNAHDHLSYDFIPPWVPVPPTPTLYGSRYEWREEAAYEDWISAENYPPTSMSDLATCPGSKWGELRNIVHGATTVQGQSQSGTTCLNRLARNADSYHGLYDGPDPDTLPDDFMRVTISGPCESGFPTRYSPAVPPMPPMAGRPASGLIVDFRDGDARRFVVHVGEGIRARTPGSSTDPTREYSCYDGSAFTMGTPDAVDLLRDDTGVPYETAVMIHGMPLTTAELDDAVTANVRFVWSPSSNIILYADTAPIAEMIDRGLTVALAPDWTVSGTGDMVSEMRYAYDYGVTMGIAALTPRRLFEMTTVDAADVLGLEDYVGRIEVGMRADIVVFSRTHPDPYHAVLDSHARDVTLTMIDGRAYYGALALEEIAVNGDCDSLDVCGNERFLCVQNTPPTQGTATVVRAADTLGSLEAELNSIIDMNEALTHANPEATELLPLFDCAP